MPDIRVDIIDTDDGQQIRLDVGKHSRTMTPERAELLGQALIRRAHAARVIEQRLQRHLRRAS